MQGTLSAQSTVPNSAHASDGDIEAGPTDTQGNFPPTSQSLPTPKMADGNGLGGGRGLMMPKGEPGVCIPGGYFLPAKYAALLALVAQTVGVVMVLRMSRKAREGKEMYINTTAVVMSEVIKVFCSLVLVWNETSRDIKLTCQKLETTVLRRPGQTLKVGIPALLYVFQNNLLFIALSNISGAVYQVSYQLKILATALLSVLILGKRLQLDKWISLVLLFGGVALIQLPSAQSSGPSDGSFITGICAVLLACITSGFAGVYLELMLKQSSTSIWVRNLQLSVCSVVLALCGAMWNDFGAIRAGGFFQGYDWVTWLAILLQSAGGLIVAAVLKYADNILKCFGNASAIVLSCLVSYMMNDFQPTLSFVAGCGLVTFSTYAYSTDVLTGVQSKYLISETQRLWRDKIGS